MHIPQLRDSTEVPSVAARAGRRCDRGGGTLVACLASAPRPEGDDLERRARGAAWLRIGGDARIVPAGWWRGHFRGRLLYAAAQGEESGRIARAAREYDLVELDAGSGPVPEVLGVVPPSKRLLAWRGPATDTASLASRLRRLSAIPARLYLLAVEARRTQDAIPPLELLRTARRRDVIVEAGGEPGLWGRVLSAALGAPLVFGSIEADGEAAGEPSLGRLIDDYGLAGTPRVERIYGIVGDSVSHSLSPRLHNAAYRALGLPAMFLTFPAASLEEFWADMAEGPGAIRLGLPLCGLTVASPHKEVATGQATEVGELSRRAASANLTYRRGDGWCADSTDPDGVVENLRRRGIDPAGRRAAVVGCGGSGRAIAAALDDAGARVTLCNRGRPRGEEASRRLGLPFVPLTTLDPADYDLVVNATPVGRADEEPPFRVGRLGRGAVVVDLVYADRATPLVAAAMGLGALAIDGREVLLVQASRQFARMTGCPMPEGLAAELLGLDGAARGEVLAPRRPRRDGNPLGPRTAAGA